MKNRQQSYHFEIPEGEIENPGNWRSDQIVGSEIKTTLSAEVVDDLLHWVEKVSISGLKAPEFSIADFEAPKAKGVLQQLLKQLEQEKGFAVISGNSFAGLSVSDMESLIWGIGLHLGTAVPINAGGDLIGHVRDHGYDIKNPDVRNYQTTEELKLHNDTCDILGLMCVQKAKFGGQSAIASATAIHNHILSSRPDLLRELYTPLPIDRRGEKGWPEEGDAPWFALPIFSYFKGKITTRYTVHEYYYESQKFSAAPRITENQSEALEYLRETARDPRFHFSFELEPGDIQLLNNYCVLHARTHFEDFEETDRKRHLLRLWLSVPCSRALHPIFQYRYRSAKPGALRGGIAPRSINA